MHDETTWIDDLAALLPEMPSDSIVSRTVFNGPGLRVTLFGFAAGQELTEHTASRPAILHFLRGRGSLTTGGRTGEAIPGTWVHMPANTPHSVRADQELVMLLLMLT
jgi:quercetin dioxygenase-like cupin family protein